MRKLIIAAVILLLIVIIFSQRSSEDISNRTSSISNQGDPTNQNQEEIKENGGYVTVNPADYLGVNTFSFEVNINKDWEIETLLNGGILNFYIPTENIKDNLDNSQIFVFSFIANDFQAPEGVSLLSRTEKKINDRPAVVYLLSQNGETSELEPSWTAETYKETSIRARDENPSRFYVFAKNPKLSEADYNHFLESIKFN